MEMDVKVHANIFNFILASYQKEEAIIMSPGCPILPVYPTESVTTLLYCSLWFLTNKT